MSIRVSSPRKVQHLRVSPDKVQFFYDNSAISQAENLLINNTRNWIAFRVRTNAPDFYIVRPNQGKIAPNDSTKLVVSVHWKAQQVLFLRRIGALVECEAPVSGGVGQVLGPHFGPGWDMEEHDD